MINVQQMYESKLAMVDDLLKSKLAMAGVSGGEFDSVLQTEIESGTEDQSQLAASLKYDVGMPGGTALSTQDYLDLDAVISSIQAAEKAESGTDSSSVSKYDKYDDIIERVAQKYNFSPALIKGIIRAESDFNPNCVSSAGAVGLMQLMTETAEEVGVTDRYDPEQNIEGATHYIRKMVDRFGGDLKLALAAYNCGPNKLAKKIGDKTGDEAFAEAAPIVQTYVNRVIKYAQEFLAG